jgi:hypothetical protein
MAQLVGASDDVPLPTRVYVSRFNLRGLFSFRFLHMLMLHDVVLAVSETTAF